MFFLFAVTLFSLSLPSSAQENAVRAAQKDGTPPDSEIWYKAVTEDSQGDVKYLRGASEVHTSEMKITADEIDFNQASYWIYARGHVRLVHYVTGDVLNADHAEYNLRTEEGKFYVVDGTSPKRLITSPGLLTTSNPFYYQGQWADRLKGRIILHNGFVTDCKMPKPWWTYDGKTFDIVPGQRAIARNSIFYFRHLPILYLPYFKRALGKSERQSGLLTPSPGHSTTQGYLVTAGYYWAINRSYDVDYLFTDYLSRGYGHQVDFRGKPSETSFLNFTFFGVQDRGLQPGNKNYPCGTEPQSECPDAKQGGAQFQVSARTQILGFQGMLDVNYLSSYLFAAAFTNNFVPQQNSIGFLQRHFDHDIYNFDIVFSRNEVYDNFESKPTVIQKLPMLETSSRLQQILSGAIPLWFSFDASGGLLSRNEPATSIGPVANSSAPTIQTPSLDTGLFNQRIDIRPTLSSAIHLAGFDFFPSISFEATDYNHDYSSNSELQGTVAAANLLRHDADFVLDFRAPPLERIFTPPKWLHLGTQLKHVIELEAQYEYVTGVANFNKIIHYDGTDIVADTNQVTIGLTNRLYKKDKNGGVNEFFTWRLKQARYFDPTFGGTLTTANQRYVNLPQEMLTPYTFLDGPRGYSPVISSLTVMPWSVFGFTYEAAYDPLHRRFDYQTFGGNIRYKKYRLDVGDTAITTYQLPVSYDYLQLFPLTNQASFTVAYGSTNRQGFNMAAQAFYDFEQHEITLSNYQVSYNNNCCGFSVELRRIHNIIRDDNQFLFSFSVANIGSVGTLPRQSRIF